ncbi:hypothetical protein [Lysinibacter sp. HNR]|nr:hypothetical protein [Lysinibacter sp. HNR]WGD37367.1 hypothetical protein FrondiHNR_00135 [Lysinibacter sp. HNR]
MHSKNRGWSGLEGQHSGRHGFVGISWDVGEVWVRLDEAGAGGGLA